MECRTKIVATLGPASSSPEVLLPMLAAGVDVVRLNLSHGTVDEHLQRLADVRAAAARLGRQTAVLADLPGPKVRSGRFPEGGTELRRGSQIRLTPGGETSSAEHIAVDYPTLLDDIHEGDRIALGDGAITMTVRAVEADGAIVEVLTGGTVQGRPGVHLPAERSRLTSPTDDDLVLARTMAAAGVDFIAVSFVRSAASLQAVRAAVAPTAVRLVAKIETADAVDRLPEIVAAADAVMVARGDLGIDCPLEDVPHLQKRIVRTCVELGVPVITATQVLESMITSPSPTRAEVGDIANAVFDGTDALMLSAETAIGADPVGVVRTMVRVAARAESEASYMAWGRRLGRVQREWGERASDERITQAITHAAGQAAVDAGADAILCCTRSGRTALAMARFRPTPRLVGLSPDAATVRALAVSWGVIAVEVGTYETTDEMVWHAVETAVRNGIVSAGQVVLVLAGAPDGVASASTDVLRIVRVR